MSLPNDPVDDDATKYERIATILVITPAPAPTPSHSSRRHLLRLLRWDAGDVGA